MQSSPPTYFVIFTAITACSVLLQALLLLAMFIVLRKLATKMEGIADEVKEKAVPALSSARSLMEDLSPKLKVATANLVDVSDTLRQEAKHVGQSVDALLDKSNAQIRRVDEMVTATFDVVDHASRALENAVAVPARRVSGVINGVRAGVETFVGRRKNSTANATGTLTQTVTPTDPGTGGIPDQKQA